MRRSYVIRELKERISWIEAKYPDRKCVGAAKELGAMQTALRDVEYLYEQDKKRREEKSKLYEAAKLAQV